MNRYLLVNNTPIHNNDYLGLSKLPNCNQKNTGNKQYTCSKLGISNANSNFRFNDVIDNLDRLLKDIDKMEQLMNFSSFATARNANDVIDAVSEQIISNGTDIGADNAWILKNFK